MTRKALGIAILLLWMAGFAWMARRNSGDAGRHLTEAALRIQPATFYYAVSYRGAQIGGASSAIDTLVAAVVSEEYFTGRFPSGDALEPVSARLRARMTRGLRLTNVSVQLERGTKRQRMNGFVQSDTTLVVVDGRSADSATPHLTALHGPIIPPALVGIAVLLGEPPRAGRHERIIVFNPLSAKPESRDIRLVRDSLFTVVDSAGLVPDGSWKAAHSDTVRAWKLGGDVSGLTVWVDAEGRVVEAAAPNGLFLRRTAFELAFERARAK